MDVLTLRDNAKQQLILIKDVETGIEYLNKVKAIETWAKAEKKDAELQNMIAEQKIRTQRVLGRLIQEGQQRGEIANSETGRPVTVNKISVTGDDTYKTLSDIGITRNQSSVFKAIANIPDDRFEQSIAEKKDAVNKAVSELTTTAMFKVSQEIKKEQRKNDFKNVELQTNTLYRVVYADPPWKYNEVQHVDEGNFQEKTLGIHYPSMSIQELCGLPVKDITEEDAVLFLWVTSPLLEECFPIIKAWGFKYKTSMVWDKVKHNVGNYVSVRHELLLICTKGSCLPDVRKLHDSVYSEDRTEHSKKPEYFRGIIDEIYPNGKRVELFARETQNNWDTWGNEI